MQENMIVQNWCGFDIRFIAVDKDGHTEWYAVLKDIADALGMKTSHLSVKIDIDYMTKIVVEHVDTRPSTYKNRRPTKPTYEKSIIHSYEYLGVSEPGIYQALMCSRRLEARKFIRWLSETVVDLRRLVGLQQYEAFMMTDQKIQKAIDDVTDIYYENSIPWWNEELMCWLVSYPSRDGDVDIWICDAEGNVDEELSELWINNPMEFQNRVYANNRKSWEVK